MDRDRESPRFSESQQWLWLHNADHKIDIINDLFAQYDPICVYIDIDIDIDIYL